MVVHAVASAHGMMRSGGLYRRLLCQGRSHSQHASLVVDNKWRDIHIHISKWFYVTSRSIFFNSLIRVVFFHSFVHVVSSTCILYCDDLTSCASMTYHDRTSLSLYKHLLSCPCSTVIIYT